MNRGRSPHGVNARLATASDLSVLLPLIELFCEADRHPFDSGRVSHALLQLLKDEALGQVWIAEEGTEAVGYAVVTWGYSLESGGREALVDEIFARQSGKGAGSVLMEAAVAGAARSGARVMFLETESHNERARDFYRRHGFVTEDSVWLSRSLLS